MRPQNMPVPTRAKVLALISRPAWRIACHGAGEFAASIYPWLEPQPRYSSRRRQEPRNGQEEEAATRILLGTLSCQG